MDNSIYIITLYDVFSQTFSSLYFSTNDTDTASSVWFPGDKNIISPRSETYLTTIKLSRNMLVIFGLSLKFHGNLANLAGFS